VGPSAVLLSVQTRVEKRDGCHIEAVGETASLGPVIGASGPPGLPQ